MKYNTLTSLVLSACSVIGAVSTTEDVQLTPTVSTFFLIIPLSKIRWLFPSRLCKDRQMYAF